jgi:hypothetical protein
MPSGIVWTVPVVEEAVCEVVGILVLVAILEGENLEDDVGQRCPRHLR